MATEWKQTTTVKPGGRVELVVPELSDGEKVEVLVRRGGNGRTTGKRPGFGNARGQIRISDDFDAPLEDFKEYS